MDILLKSILYLLTFGLFVYASKILIRMIKPREPLKPGEKVEYKGRNIFMRKGGKDYDPAKDGMEADTSSDEWKDPSKKS